MITKLKKMGRIALRVFGGLILAISSVLLVMLLLSSGEWTLKVLFTLPLLGTGLFGYVLSVNPKKVTESLSLLLTFLVPN